MPMSHFFLLDKLEKKPKQELLDLKKRKSSIILFGSGNWGVTYLRMINEVNVLSVSFCDNNPMKRGMLIEGIPVIDFDDLKRLYGDSYISITSIMYYDEILNQLKENNMLEKPIVAFDVLFIDEYNNYFKYVSKNFSMFDKVYRFLSDELSEQLFYHIINYKISADAKYLIPLRSSSPQYFDSDIIKLSEHEIFVDCGAYIGDTVEEFIRQTKGQYKKIYSFEPEEKKQNEFKEKLSRYKNIELFPYGLWNRKKTLSFVSKDDGTSKVGKNGDIEILVTSIDEELEDVPVTFIKMDIEGSELEALRGAKQTIQRYKPKLAICIYHKLSDIVEIPLYIKELVPEYKLYIRHYSTARTETVLYAVVEE